MSYMKTVSTKNWKFSEDNFKKVTGEAHFAGDSIPSDALRVVIIRSKIPHGILKAISLSEVSDSIGIIRLITAQDIPGNAMVGSLVRDQPVLAFDRVRYIGDPIALLIIEQSIEPNRIIHYLKIELSELPAVFSPKAALSENGLFLHGHSNLLATRRIVNGNVDDAFKKADVVIEREYEIGWLEHAYLETEVGFAHYRDGIITIYYPTQCPHHARDVIVEMLNLNNELVQIVPSTVGGGFGGKLEILPMCHLALAAYICRRTVFLIYNREESITYSSKSHPLTMKYKTAASLNGKLIAAQVDFTLDTGAYASFGPGVLTRTAIHALGPYSVQNCDVLGRLVYTNNPIAGAMRGFGVSQIAFAYESQMDLIAHILQKDPFELRLINVLRTNGLTITGQKLNFNVGLPECIKKAKEFSSSLAELGRQSAKGYKYGIGAAAFFYGIGNTGHINPASVSVIFDPYQGILFKTSTINMGQNPIAAIKRIIARELGVSEEFVKSWPINTSESPDSGITSASRSIYYVGNAAKEAAQMLRSQLEVEASLLSGGALPYFRGGTLEFVNRETGCTILTLSELGKVLVKSRRVLSATSTFAPEVTDLESETSCGKPYATYSFGCHVVAIRVDIETWQIEVINYCAIHDSGTILDKDSAIGQVHGGIGMGIGMALTEDLIVEKGKVLTTRLKDYILPRISDMPKTIDVIFVENVDETGPFGAKGLGEPTIIPVSAAISNAIYDAVGFRIYRLPMTPQNLWEEFCKNRLD